MLRAIRLATAALLVVPALAFTASVQAQSSDEGQIEGGNIYRIKNVTKNVDFTDPANADACDVVQYKVRIHNPGPSPLTDVRVRATLPGGVANSHISTVTVSAINANPRSTSDTATLNLSSAQSLSYETGSTQLLGANGEFMRTLPDGITQGGVGIGNVGVSINEKRFVQFKVKVSCPEVPQPQVKGKVLPVTGPASVAGLFVGASALAGVGHYVYRRYRG
jgi:uncharacterized repeat protein (TIGR01451 family)